MASVLIASFNVNGLRTNSKRAKIFAHFHRSPYDIILLQETHVLPSDVSTWQTEWRSPSYWNPGPSYQSCGVAILLNSHKLFNVTDSGHDSHGRVLFITILHAGKNIQIFSLYAPATPVHRPRFFLSLPPFLRPNSVHVLGGDFNVVSNPSLDRTGSPPTASHTQGLPELNLLLHQFALIDIWRFNHPAQKQFTWTSQKSNEPHIKSRLDVFFIPRSFCSNYILNEFLPTVWSDHLYITLHLPIFPAIPRGANYWKLNTDVLPEPAYQREITKLLNHRKSIIHHYDSVIEWFAVTKLHIKLVTQLYCRLRRSRHREAITRLQSEITQLQATVPCDPSQLASLYAHLHSLQSKFILGVVVRSREQHLLNEEHPSHFFFHQEQTIQQRKHITQIQSPTGVLHTAPIPVLTTLRDFYQDLYTRRTTSTVSQDHFLSQLSATVPPDLAVQLDSPITSAELCHTITHMNTNKSPGIDGLPIEFYQVFWPQLQQELTLLANEIFILHLSPNYTQRLAVLTLLYKTGDRSLLQNWRPISLLCADYKIVTKTITTRLQLILPHIIHPDQTCSVPGRHIFSTLYLIRDVLCYTQRKQQRAYLLSLDFQKAFDSIDHAYLLKTLERFRFGPLFIGFVLNIYTDIHSLVINNGNLSSPISITRGIRQGCPLSLPLYCIVAETIANAIRNHRGIRGIYPPGAPRPLKVAQYADDTTLFLADPTSIDTAYTLFETYAAASSCHLNPSKTKGLILGPDVTPPDLLHPVDWQNDSGVCILGITFFPDLLVLQNFNWTNLLRTLKDHLDRLRYRPLSLRGKVVILNTMALSKIWFLSSVIHIPPWAIKTLESHIFKFLWDTSGPEPIKRTTLYLPISRGGLGLLHPLCQNQALLLKYFLHLVNPTDTTPWLYYGRYWIASRLPKHHHTWHFLTSNAIPKYNGTDPPILYQHLYTLLSTHIAPITALPSPTVKDLYQILHTANYRLYTINSQLDWDYIFTTPLPWARLWQNNYSSFNVGPPEDILFKILHNCLPTGHRLAHNMAGRGGYDSKCHTCSNADETILHLFACCPIPNQIWASYAPIYSTLQPNHVFTYESAVLSLNVLAANTSKATQKLLLTITHAILFEIWTSRNKRRYERIAPNLARSLQTISTTLTFIFKTHFTHHQRQRTLPLFEKRFCIRNAVCHVLNDRLVVTLPT